LLSNPAALEQFNSLMSEFKTLPGNAAIQGKFADESVWQKAINAQTNFKSILTLLGEKTLPEVSSGLTGLNNVLSLIIEKLGSGDGSVAAVSRVAVYGLGSLGAAIMLLGKYLMYAALVKYLGGASAVLGMLGGAAAALVSPVTLAIAALAGLAVAAVAIYNNWDKVKAKFNADMNSARNWLDELDKSAKKRFPSLFPDGTPNRAGGPPDATIRAPKAGEDLSFLSGTGKSYASNYTRGGGSSTVQVHSTINMDGRKVAEAVTEHQANEASRSLSSGYFDSSHAAPAVGLG
jgi:hypothetical protein